MPKATAKSKSKATSKQVLKNVIKIAIGETKKRRRRRRRPSRSPQSRNDQADHKQQPQVVIYNNTSGYKRGESQNLSAIENNLANYLSSNALRQATAVPPRRAGIRDGLFRPPVVPPPPPSSAHASQGSSTPSLLSQHEMSSAEDSPQISRSFSFSDYVPTAEGLLSILSSQKDSPRPKSAPTTPSFLFGRSEPTTETRQELDERDVRRSTFFGGGRSNMARTPPRLSPVNQLNEEEEEESGPQPTNPLTGLAAQINPVTLGNVTNSQRERQERFILENIAYAPLRAPANPKNTKGLVWSENTLRNVKKDKTIKKYYDETAENIRTGNVVREDKLPKFEDDLGGGGLFPKP